MMERLLAFVSMVFDKLLTLGGLFVVLGLMGWLWFMVLGEFGLV